MRMTPEIFTAICAGVTLIIYFTATIIGATISIFRKIEAVKTTILLDVAAKHKENDLRYQALNALVIRHDTILDPEFNGHFHG